MCNFILQIFEDLDRMFMNKLQISSGQKMSKREQERKIKAVREQINTLKLRVTKLESCLHTLKEDPDQYFQNLNTENREYIDWKKRNVKSEKDQENKSSNEEEEEDRGATTTSTGAADNFGFFQTMVGFCHISTDMGRITILFFFIWTHCPWVLLMYFWGQCVLSFIGWHIFLPASSFI